MTIIELRQQRAGLVKQARGIVDLAEGEKRGMNQEEENQYGTIMAEVDRLLTEIERRERLEALETEIAQPMTANRPEPTDNRTQSGRGSDEYRRAFGRWLSGGLNELQPQEVRALQADSDIYGGFLYPPEQFVNSLIQAVDNAVYMRQWATRYQVTGAESLGVPSLDTDPADPAWTSELAIGTEDSSMAFGKRELKPNPLAKYIKISRKLLRKAPSAESLVMARLAYKFAVTEENAFLNGSGVGEPLGVFTASANGISTGRDVSTGNTITAVTFDGLKEAKYTLKGQYWPRARWIFHRTGVKNIAKLKDGDGQYIWAESVRVGEPDRLLGLPLFMSEYCPSTFTTLLYVGILGDFSNYWIADSLAMEMQRLDELYAATNQVGFIGRLETDGQPVLEEAFVRVKLA